MKNERAYIYPTELLFEEDAYCKEFTATVLSCEAVDGGFRIELDRTAFFPEGGGQNSDSGLLDDIDVSKVTREDGHIYHYVETGIRVGSSVTGRIDWDKRFDYMQNHTGEHLVCGLIYKMFGFENVGFHLGNDVITVDVDGVLTDENIETIVILANRGVAGNVAITSRVYTALEAQKREYRSKLEFTDDVRLVTIEGYDCCACCAPHVARTGEIGMVQILSRESHKQGTRFTMISGTRAVIEAIGRQRSVSSISVLLSSKPEDVVNAVENLLKNVKERKEENVVLRKELSDTKLSMFQEQWKINQSRNVCFFEENFDEIQMRTLINGAMELCDGYVCGFIGSKKDYRYVIASNTKDARVLTKAVNALFSGRGGGSDRMTQGSLKADEADIMKYIGEFREEL